jgi:hypothetical protein
MNNSHFDFFSNEDLIPNVNPKDKPNQKPIPKDKPNPKPIPQDKDEDLDEYDDSCPNCNNSLSNHTRNEKIQCALSRIRGA